MIFSGPGLILSSPGTLKEALGKLQEVLEGFWVESIDFSFFFMGFGGVNGWARGGGRGWAGTP